MMNGNNPPPPGMPTPSSSSSSAKNVIGGQNNNNKEISSNQLYEMYKEQQYRIWLIDQKFEHKLEHLLRFIGAPPPRPPNLNSLPSHLIPHPPPRIPFNQGLGLGPGMMRHPLPPPPSPSHLGGVPPGMVPPPSPSFLQNGHVNKNASPRTDSPISHSSYASFSDFKSAGDLTAEDSRSLDGDIYSEGGVLIYIDNSNIWINTMEASARFLKFRNDIRQDQRIRINMKRLLNTASAGRPIIRAVLYGSEPPPVEKFWDNVKQSGIEPQVTRKSGYSNREREVDQTIMLDIGEDIVIHQEHAKHGGTVIIFTGDGGMISAVRRAIKYNWNVEVWAYRSSLAKDYPEESQKAPDKFKIKYLDDYFQELVFHTLEWRSQIPRERSFVFTFTGLPEDKDKRQEVFETCVKIITELVRMPMAARYLKQKENLPLSSKKQTHLAIICSVAKLILKEDSRSDAHHKNASTDSAPSASSKNRSTSTSVSTSFHFSPESWERVENLLNLQCYPDEDICTLQYELEEIVQDSTRSGQSSLENPKYEFNADVYHKVEEVVRNASTISNTNISEDLKTAWNLISRLYKPKLRSAVQFFQDMDIENFENEMLLESPANDDDGGGGYIVQAGKKARRAKFQKYSQECKYSFRCFNGFKCSYSHTDKEKEFFKIQTDPKIRTGYKFKDCDHYKAQKCKYKKEMSYMCPFAHGYFCLTCRTDEDGGHNMATCPNPQAPSPQEPDALDTFPYLS